MAENPIVYLEDMADTNQNSPRLFKNIQGISDKTFGDVFDYLIDTRGDENNQAYESASITLASTIKEQRDRVRAGGLITQDTFTLHYKNTQGGYVPVSFQDRISDKSDILHDERRVLDGTLRTFKAIYLGSQFNPGYG